MNEPTRYPSHVLANLFGITDRRIRQLAGQGIIPAPLKGKYELAGSVRGYVRYLESLREDECPSLRRERALLTREQRLAAERKNELAEKELVPAGEAKAEMATLAGRMVEFLETLPGVLERDAGLGLNGAQVAGMRGLIDRERGRLRRKAVP